MISIYSVTKELNSSHIGKKNYRKDERTRKTSGLLVYSTKKPSRPSRLGRSRVCFRSGLSGLGLRVYKF
jgi:hypothetical protein